MRHLFLLSLLFSLSLLGVSVTPSTFFTPSDTSRLSQVFGHALTSDDLTSLAYGALGMTLMGKNAPAQVCAKIEGKLTEAAQSTKNAFLLAQAAQAAKCGIKPTEDIKKVISSALSEESTVSDLYHAVLAQKAFGVKIDGAAVVKSLEAALKKDDSLANLGYAFKTASVLDNVDAKAIFDRVEDAVVQADEVDGRILQFEGGLGITSLIVTGVFDLSAKMKKPAPVTKEQAGKFANYFLGRKNVHMVKGACNLLEALNVLTNNQYHIPVAVTLVPGFSVVSESSPKVQVRVTNLLGQSLGKMDVTVDNAMRQSDGAVVMSKSKMSPVGSDETLYEIDMMSAKPGRGFYEVTFSAAPVKADARLVGNTGAKLIVKALGSVVIEGAQFGVVDTETTSPKLAEVSHPNKISKVMDADHHHKVIFKFTLKDKASNEKISAHQTFVRLSNSKTGAEIIFIAESDSNSVYTFDLDVNSKSKDFGSESGLYQLHLIVGDSVISNPISWHVADVRFKFLAEDEEQKDKKEKKKPETSKPLPEIRHLFREPEKRPPTVVSNLFTVLCLLPIMIMLIFWLRIGVNISGFPLSLTAIGFHVGLGSIFTLYYYFWLQLDMFTTFKYLLMIGVVTFLCGNSLLVRIAEKRRH